MGKKRDAIRFTRCDATINTNSKKKRGSFFRGQLNTNYVRGRVAATRMSQVGINIPKEYDIVLVFTSLP